MINHARTLLGNRAGGAQALSEPGEEYIPVEFTGVKMPPWLKSAWNIMFGSNPDNMYRNFQLSRLLRIVHATEYEPYLFYHDSRITYDPAGSDDFSSLRYGVTWSFETAAVTVNEVSVIGPIVADESNGVMRFEFSVNLNNGLAVVTNLRTGALVETQIYGGGVVSQAFHLPGTPLKAKITFSSSTQATWDHAGVITVTARPARTPVDQLDAVSKLGGAFERNLFGTELNEPFDTFYSMWNQQSSFPERVAGLVLAMMYRLHEMYYSNA